jgi:hypothetical protein
MPGDFGSFLTFIGSSAAIGAVISFIADNWAWFKARESGQKVVILLAVSILMGIASHLLVKYVPVGVIAEVEPYYQIIIASIVTLTGSVVYHKLIGVPQEKKNANG